MTVLKAEFLKIKRIWGLNLCYIFPVLLTSVFVYGTWKGVHSSLEIGSVNPIAGYYFQLFAFFSPIAILLVVFSLIQVENKNKMWESSVLLPVSKTKLYINKNLICIFFVFVYMIASYILYIISIEIFSLFFPQLSSITKANHAVLLNFFSRTFVGYMLFTIIAIPIFINIESPVMSLGILLFAIFLSMLLTQQTWYVYYPFSYHFIVFKTARDPYEILKDRGLLVTLVYSILSFGMGLFSFTKLETPKS